MSQEIKPIESPKETKGNKIEHKPIEKPKIVSIEKPKKTKETRVTLGITIDRQLNDELRKRAEKHRLSVSRFVELTLRKAFRL